MPFVFRNGITNFLPIM